MVCIPCIVIPFLLWVYHKFLQPWIYPVVSKFWSPKAVEETQNGDIKKCPLSNGSSGTPTQEVVGGEDTKKKN